VRRLTFNVVVSENHGLQAKQGTSFKAFLQSQQPGTEFTLTIEPPTKPIRSNDQNAYYWVAVVTPLAEHFGYTPLEMHEELKYMFNPKPSKIDPMRVFGGTTTLLKEDEFQEYLESIKVWAMVDHQFVIED